MSKLGGAVELLVDDLVAEIDALVADVDAGAGDQLLDLPLGLAAEAAEKLLVGVSRSCHAIPLRTEAPTRRSRSLRRCRMQRQCCEITRSMIPYSFASSELMK